MPNETLVILYNDSANVRRDIDPELGFTPVFPDLDMDYITHWVNSGRGGVIRLIKKIIQLRPKWVILQDLRWTDKCVVALWCRFLGIGVAMRSDKNHLSEKVHSGFYLWCERFIVKILFDMLCPVSEMTTDYYKWPVDRPIQSFPYCTNEKKFTRPVSVSQVQRKIRSFFGIPNDAFIFLSVVKFVDRENPRAVIKAFERVVKIYPNTWLLMVGAGPNLESDQFYVKNLAIPNIVFAGYVPYIELENYFFSADVFVHLARCEPWGISPQDALLTGLGLIASNKVGSAVCHLADGLSHFLVPVENVDTATNKMMELINHKNIQYLFEPAKAKVQDSFTTESVVKYWTA